MERLWRLTPKIGLVAAVTLLVAGIALALYNERAYLTQKRGEATVQAQILGATVAAAVVFGDREAAQEYVNALAANPEIRAAVVHDGTGALLASYVKDPGRAGPEWPPSTAISEGDRLIVTTPVVQAGSQVGTVSLQTVTEPLWRRLQRYGAIGVLVTMAALMVVVLGAAHGVLTRANAQLEARARDLAAANRSLQMEMQEREKAEEALRRAQRIEAVGQLTAGIAHDFNNLLTAVIGNLDMLARRHRADERSRKMTASAQNAAERCAKLTMQLLAFSRRQRLAPQPVDLNEVVHGLDELLRSTLGATTNFELRLAPDLPIALADPSQVEQMLLNLAINARDAMPGGGTIVIATSAERIDASGRQEEPPPGDYVAISVTDTGTGIEAEVLDRVFEPFFTTKGVGKGSGLGLSQVLGIAQQLGGGVRIRTAPGAGTTLQVFLPRAKHGDEATKPGGGAAGMPLPRPAATLLLVDDDSEVRSVTAALLREAGHTVLEADGGNAALAVFARRAQVDVMVADFAMPGMNGVELARRAREVVPGLPVVFVTGYADTATLMAYTTPDWVVQKPFRTAELLAIVERARGGAGAGAPAQA